MAKRPLLELFHSLAEYRTRPAVWLVTGVAGFIGSNLLEVLLLAGQRVVGLDDFSTGHRHNLSEVRARVGPEAWDRFRLLEGDIARLPDCAKACQGVDIVLHQAALGSVPRSVIDPIATNSANVVGFLNMLVASRDAGVERFVYAASSSTYGDHPGLPKIEDQIGRPLSPYAVTKYVNELYADVFARTYGMKCIGLRYFNVFGPRQDPEGAYAAVIPKWISSFLKGDPIHVNGDGSTSRDFCYVDNVVQANLRAALVQSADAVGGVYNVAVGERTSLLELYGLIRSLLVPRHVPNAPGQPEFRNFRTGDVLHSLACITKAESLLGYRPTHTVGAGLLRCIDWYVDAHQKAPLEQARI